MLTTSIMIAGAVLALTQQSSAVNAVYPEDPETWTLEYPAAIAAPVEDYYGCLKGGSYTIGSDLGFETQYREDITRCAKLGAKYEKAAVSRLSGEDGDLEQARADAARIFENVRQIHLARGRSLDQTIRTDLRASEAYRTQNGLAPGDTAESRACVAQIRTLTDRRDAFADSRREEIEARHRKNEFTDEDRAAINAYTAELSRYANIIAFERSRCPASDYVDLTTEAAVQSKPSDAGSGSGS